MKKSKNTKRALLTSVLSLVLCCAMFIGSTFAWFTDTATTGVNKIQAGNLDIKLSYKNANDTEYAEVSADTTDLFVDANGNAMLWEPGAVSVCYFKLENLGTLDIKYVLSVLSKDVVKGTDGAALSKVLKTAVVDNTTVISDRAAAITAAKAANAESVLTYEKSVDVMVAKDTYEFAMVIYFPEEIGNTHEGLVYNLPTDQTPLETELSISLYATQAVSESDSFDNTYDEKALFDNQIQVSTQEALNTAITNAPDNQPVELILADGTYSFTEVAIRNKNITFTGTKNAVFDMSAQQGVNGVQDMVGTTLTLNGVTVKWSDANSGYQGIKNPAKVVYKDCAIEGTQFMYSGADFINCTFETEDSYAVYTRASGDYTFTNCTFTTGGRAIMMYHDAVITASVTLNNCTFSDDGTYTDKDKAAVETGDYGSACNYTIVINNCNITKGFEANNSTSALWGNKDNMPTDRLNVIIDGVDVY